MKQMLQIVIFIFVVLFSGCKLEDDTQALTLPSYGTLFISGGLYDCPYQITLDDETILHPVNDTLLIPFKSGQRIEFDYTVIQNVPICEGMIDVWISNVQVVENTVLQCGQITTLEKIDFNYLQQNPIGIESYTISDHTLMLETSYGGCEPHHPVNLVVKYPCCLTPPVPPIPVYILHDSRGEVCNMLLQESYCFDLEELYDQTNNFEFVLINYRGDSIEKRALILN